jgi:hypothetical protein
MSNSKKIADEILKDYPKCNKVIVTEDGQAFFVDLDATRHHQRNGFKKEPEVFFREGFEPEDTKELEEDLQITKEANATLGDAIKLVILATDLEADAPEVDGQTPEVVAKVVGLREKLETSQTTFNEVAEAVTRACDLENEVPELTLSDEALPIVKSVIELRAQLSQVSNELATLKALKVEVVEEAKDVKNSAETAAKK